MAINNLSQHFLQSHPRESAKVLQDFPADDLVSYLNETPDTVVANIIRYFLPGTAIACLIGMEVSRAAAILEKLGIDNAARLLRNMKTSHRQRLLDASSSAYAYRLRSVLRYPNGTVGQYMSPNIFIASEDMVASQIFEAARAASSELQGDIFIVNDRQHLTGIVDIKSLVFADPQTEVNKIMKIPDVVFNARANLKYVQDNPKWKFKEALPVVDHNNVFVGILKRTVMQDAVDSEHGQADEDESFMETMMEVVELFWDICTGLLIPKSDTNTAGRSDDRRK